MPYYQQLAEFEQPTSVPPVVPAPIAPAAPTGNVAPWGEGPNWTGIAVVAGAALLLYCMSGKYMRRNDTVTDETELKRQVNLIRDNIHLFQVYYPPGSWSKFDREVAQYPTALENYMRIRLNQLFTDGFDLNLIETKPGSKLTKILLTDDAYELPPDELSRRVRQIQSLIKKSEEEKEAELLDLRRRWARLEVEKMPLDLQMQLARLEKQKMTREETSRPAHSEPSKPWWKKLFG